MRRRGITLIELMVSIGLMGLLMVVLIWVLMPALRVWTRGQQQSQVQQAALVTARWVRADLERACPESVAVGPGSLTMVTRAYPMQFDETGAPKWESYVYYWRSNTGEVHRQAQTLSPAWVDPQPSPAPAQDPNSRVVARLVTEFQATEVRPGTIAIHIKADDERYNCVLDTAASTVFGLTQNPAPSPSPSP